MKKGDANVNSAFRTNPTRVNCTTMRPPAINSRPPSPRLSANERPALKISNKEASPMSQ